MSSDERLPLSGVVLLEAMDAKAPAALWLAAGLCGRVAADLGATVLRIEPAEGDPLRRMPPFVGRVGAAYAFLTAGKRLIRSAQAEQMFADLSRRATAVILDDARYRQRTSALAQTLPIVIGTGDDAPSSEFTVEALSGLLDLVGDPEREPLRLGGHQTAYAAGLAAFLGLIGALARNDKDKARGPVRISLLETMVWLNWKTLGLVARSGETPTRPGATAEWLVVPCADGFVALVYRTTEWEALLSLANDARLREDRFQSAEGRRLHAGELNTFLSDVFSGMTRAEVREAALKKGLPLGPVWSPQELVGDPHMQARDFFHDALIDGIAAQMPRLPVRWNGRSFEPTAATVMSDAALREFAR